VDGVLFPEAAIIRIGIGDDVVGKHVIVTATIAITSPPLWGVVQRASTHAGAVDGSLSP
jgi:hypothetical protein